MASKGLEMPVSGSDKLEVPVLGCRFSEKVEHLPIKKRRVLFKTSSPPHNIASSDVTQSVAACLDSSSQEVKPKPDASYPPATSLTVANLCQSASIDTKVNGDKFVETSKKASDNPDTCGISLGSGIGSCGIKKPEPPGSIKLEPNCVTLPHISATETGLHLHISTVPSKDVASSKMHCSPPGKPTVDNSTPENQETSEAQKSAVCDERLNWDLNTVMAWEESPECDNNTFTTYAERKNTNKEVNYKGLKKEQECGSAFENIGNKTLTNLRSLSHTVHEPEPEERKPNSNDIKKLLFPANSSAPPHVTINNIKSLLTQNLGISSSAVPSIVKLEYPACDVSKKQVHVNHMNANANDLVCPMTVSTGFSLGYSLSPGFNHSINAPPLEKNIVSGSNGSHAITTALQTAENENLNLSLVTVASLENEVRQSGTTFEEDDKSKIKRLIASNRIAMEKTIDKGTASSQDANKALNQTTIGSLLAIQSSVLPEVQDQPSAVSSVHDVTISDAQVPIKREKSPPTPPSVSNNKEVCQVPLDNGFGFENFPSDIQESEVDNVDEMSVGYDSQFEDGEVRESSIQTWEGSDGDNRENEHGTDNRGTCNSHENDSQCVPESSSRIRSTDIGSQKGTDEISSVLLPEKPDTSEQVSNSEPNETNNREVSMKDESESDQWKMNVSGSELLPEDYNVTKMKDFSSSKFYRREPLSRVGEPSTRDSFINRGRFRMQGYSSSNADDAASRSSVREPGVVRSFRRGNTKFSPHARTSNRGGATWNRSPGRDREPPFFRDVDNLTNEVCLDQNDDVSRPVAPYVARQSFRTRLVGNREEDDFRARLGLRPAGDTRFVGRGRSLRYGSRGGGPRGRYGGPANEYDEPLEYSNSFPRRRCFSPTERRENHPCTHHHTGSTSPPRSRTRSRSPRMRRPRSPNYRFEADGYNMEGRNNNNSPPGTRWVKYKQRSTVFHRSPPPIGERLSFYDSSRKTKQNENYRSGPPGRFSDVHGGVMDHGYRRGGLVKRHEMGRPVKHIEYDEEDGYGPVEGMEFHGRGNPKAYSNGTESRFRDLPRRPREERENW